MAALSLATADRGRSTKVAEPYGLRGRGRCPRGPQLRMIGFNHAPVGQDLGHIVLRLGDPRNAFDGQNATGTGIIGRKRRIDAPELTKLPAQITGGAAKLDLKAVANDHDLSYRSGVLLSATQRILGA